jgi:hypothetical protein
VLEPPTTFDAWPLVDWIEGTILLEDLVQLGRPEILRRFGVDQPDSAELDQAMEEIRRRRAVARSAYPLSVEEDGTVGVDPEVDSRVYSFLWLLSAVPAPYRQLTEFTTVAPSFDLLAREALKSYLGPGSEAVRFGVPVTDGRSTDLAKALTALAAQMGLTIVSVESVRPSDQDGGVDVVGWKPLASGGKIFPCHLMQCTVGANFKRKASDIVPEMWMQFINFGTSPTVGLAVPFALSLTADELRDINWRASLFLDRLALCEHIDAAALTSFEPEWSFMAEWVTLERKRQLDALTQPSAVQPDRRRKR